MPHYADAHHSLRANKNYIDLNGVVLVPPLWNGGIVQHRNPDIGGIFCANVHVGIGDCLDELLLETKTLRLDRYNITQCIIK